MLGAFRARDRAARSGHHTTQLKTNIIDGHVELSKSLWSLEVGNEYWALEISCSAWFLGLGGRAKAMHYDVTC